MNSTIVDSMITVAGMIIGIAALSVILSPNSKTVQVIQAGASGFGNALGVAMSPVTGNDFNIDTSYPGANDLLNNLNLPMLH